MIFLARSTVCFGSAIGGLAMAGEKRHYLWVVLFFALTWSGFIWQPCEAATVEQIALMKGSDRQKVLIEGAKKEGKVVWYSTLIVDQLVRPMKAAFEKEYPFLQVEYFRGNTERVVQKAVSEYQAKHYEVDMLDGTTTPTLANKAGIMQRFFSPPLAEYPAELKDAQGIWGATNLYFLTLGYNTRMVKPNEVPKTLDDLLNPRWKGNMIWSTSRGSGAPMMIGNILLSMGPEAGKAYLLKLAKQNIAKSTASNRQILDLVIAGEHPLALHIFNHHAFISRKAGAPVDWQPIEPVTATFNGSGLAKNAPHPHAAMLLLDFIFSKKGQKVFQDVDYLPADPQLPAKQADLKPGGGRFKRAVYVSPDVQFEKGNEWIDLFQKEFVNK
jgi:ABC-type Fe3+ transport system substrate-binding protein